MGKLYNPLLLRAPSWRQSLRGISAASATTRRKRAMQSANIALLLALALGLALHYSLLSAKGAKAVALVACLAGVFQCLARLVFPGNARLTQGGS